MTQSRDSAMWGDGVGPTPVTDEDILLEQLLRAAADGRAGTYVIFPYCISIVFLSFKRNSGIKFVPAGSSRVLAGLPYLLISSLVGWWGIPWGIAWTLQSIVVCLSGGRDLTPVIDPLRTEFAAQTQPPALAHSPGSPSAPATTVVQARAGQSSYVASPPSDASSRARRDSESVARVLLRAWNSEIPGKEFAETVLAAIRSGDMGMERNAIAMLSGGAGNLELPAGVDPMEFILEETTYMGTLATEVAARLRPVAEGDPNAEAHVALLFDRASAHGDDRWATALAMFDGMPGWRQELRSIS